MTIHWACPSCDHSNADVLRDANSNRCQVRCRHCGVRGPVADGEYEAWREWNKLAERVQLARR